MKTIIDITESLSIDVEKIELILYLVYHAKASRSSHAYETISQKIAQARRHNRFYDFTNERDKVKSLFIMSSGTICATSLTRAKINQILNNKRVPKTRRSKYEILVSKNKPNKGND